MHRNDTVNAQDPRLGATLPKRWVEDFTIALRAREVPGPAIGDAIKSVEDYCAQSGETPEAAFGSPGDYAAALELPGLSPADSLRSTAVAATPAAIGLLGLAVPSSIDALQAGRPLTFTLGTGVTAVIMIAVALAVWRWIEPLLTRRWLGLALLWVAFMAAAFAPILLPQRLFDLPATLGLVGGAVALAVSVVGSFLTWREDPVVDPTAAGAPRPRISRPGIVAIVGFPAVVIALSVVAWLT